jgi:hypothetical protein
MIYDGWKILKITLGIFMKLEYNHTHVCKSLGK